MPDPSITIWRAQTDRGSWLRLRYFHGDDWVEFVVDEGGSTVWMSRSPTVPLEEAAGLLLGPAFSCVLGQRGVTCLHAAVVALDDKVIALVGRSGAGKSTTALACVQRGAVLVSDDVAVLTESGGRISAAAGTPSLRMRPDSALSLLGSFESLRPTWSAKYSLPPKRYFPVASADALADHDGRPLDFLYVLAPWSQENPEPSLRPLTPAQALAKLMAHRHMVRAASASSHRRDFEILARLAETASVRDLLRPAGLESTKRTVAAIISDVRHYA